jgi:hypothetical protein
MQRALRFAHTSIQIEPSKTKEMQEKMLGLAWIYLVESGLFKGL